MNKLTKQEKKIVGWVNNNINELALLNESNLINRNNCRKEMWAELEERDQFADTTLEDDIRK